MKKLIMILTLALVGFSQAQTKNVFLDNAFWETNPSIEVINQKIAEGNNVAALDGKSFDAVVKAILAKAPIAVIKHLLSQKGNPTNKLTHDKRTYVFWAAYAGHVELVDFLIKNKARLDIKDSHSYSPLTFAAATGQTNTKIYDLLINHGIDVKTDLDEHGANALLLAVSQAKNFDLLNYFISKGLSLNSVDYAGNNAFSYAAKSGNKTMLKALIKKGLPYKTLNKNGGNALLMATRGGRRGYNTLAFFKYLESLGINPNVTNKDGETPLHNLAYGNKDTETFNYFIAQGVSVNQVDKDGNTPLINATKRNSLEIIKLLSDKTQDINRVNNKGRSALTNAMSNRPKAIQFLLEKGANAQLIDTKGNNLAYYLMQSFHPKDQKAFSEKMTLLVNKGLNLTKPQKDGNTLYHLAIEKNNTNLLKMLQDFKIDINAKNNDGLTALHQAAMTANDAVTLKHLIAMGVDPSIKTDFDETTYELAQENELLKKHHINISFLK